PMPPAPAGPADGSAPVCATLIVDSEYAVGPASALTASTAAVNSPKRRAAVRCSFNSGSNISNPAASTPVNSTTQRSHGCHEGVWFNSAKLHPAVRRAPPAKVARGNHEARHRQSTDIAAAITAPIAGASAIM